MMWYLNDVICDFNKNVSKFNVSSENTDVYILVQ